MTHSLRPIVSIAQRVQALSGRTTLLTAIGLEALIVFLDVITGSELSFSIFYVLPISMVAWRLGRWPGLAASVLSALAWYLAERTDGRIYSDAIIAYWNAAVRLVFFAIITHLLVALHVLVDQQAAEARVDSLTGLLNRRGFNERADLEIARARRSNHPVTIACFDIDGFKQLNDTKGHAAGDLALNAVATATQVLVRQLDVVGRMGGDEFVVLFPDTSAADAHLIVERLRNGLSLVGHQAGIGFSIGVVTFDAAPADLESAVQRADRVMYEVKRNAKGTVRYENEPALV